MFDAAYPRTPPSGSLSVRLKGIRCRQPPLNSTDAVAVFATASFRYSTARAFVENTVPQSRVVVAPTTFALELKAKRVVATHRADVEIARHEDVVVARAEHREAATEHRPELKADREILRGRQRVESRDAREADVANAPEHVRPRDAVRRRIG